MAAITEVINKGAGASSNVLGLNNAKQILKKLKSPRALWGFAPGASLANDSLSAVRDLQKQGKLIILRGVNTTEENGDDDNIETLDDTTKAVTNLGKYAFSVDFTNGLDFHKALNSISGDGAWNFAFVTSSGDLFGTTDKSGNFTGFDTGMIQASKLVFGTTQATQREGLMFQFLERDEVDSEFAFIDRQNLPFNPLKIEDITQSVVSYVNNPANTDTTVTVKVTTSDNVTAVEGLDYTYFLRTSDGATENPTAGDDSATAGTYVLTVAAISTNEVETIRLYDNSNNRPIIEDPNGDLFKSNIATATATA